MIRFSLGVLFGVIAMSNMQEIKTSGLQPWHHRIESANHQIHVVLDKLPKHQG